MKTNKILSLAIMATKVTRVLFVLLCLIVIIASVDWFSNPENYEIHLFGHVENGLIKAKDAYVIYTLDDKSIDLQTDYPFSANHLIPFSLLWNDLQLFVFILLYVLSLTKFLKVMRSIKSLTTFREQNVRLFRQIGVYLFIAFLLSICWVLKFDGGTLVYFYVPTLDIALSIAAFILAEIFKEGNRLHEDNQLTV